MISFVVFEKVSKVKINLLKISLPITYGSILCSISAIICNDVISKYQSSKLALMLAIVIGGGVYLVTLYLMGFKLVDTIKFRKSK